MKPPHRSGPEPATRGYRIAAYREEDAGRRTACAPLESRNGRSAQLSALDPAPREFFPPVSADDTAFQSGRCPDPRRRELSKKTDILLAIKRGTILVGCLFALFCGSLEVERLGQAFETNRNHS